MPIEDRDQAKEAEAWYDAQREIKRLIEENMHLKELLRTNGIAWPSSGAASGVNTLPSAHSEPMRESQARLPNLPTEIVIRIMEFALTSDHPIVDPLSKSTTDHLTLEERSRGKTFAIGFLATSKANRHDGTRFFWANNTFVFTTPHALQVVANLRLETRSLITHVTFRIVARF